MGWTGINGMVCVDRYLSGMERINSVVCVARYMTRMESINGVCGQVPEWDGKG